MRSLRKGLILVFFISIGLFGGAKGVWAAGEFWSTPVKISNTSNHSISPANVTDSSGYLHSVWMETAVTSWGYTGPVNPGIVYSFWNGDGWSTPAIISQSNGVTETPSIAVDSSDNIYVVWQDSGDAGSTPPNATGSQWRVVMRKKTSGGWQTPVVVSSGIDSTETQTRWPTITVSPNGTIHVAFMYLASGTSAFKIYHTSSTDGGSNWASPVEVGDGDDSELPFITADSGNNVHLVYETHVFGSFTGTPGVKYRRLPSGSTWSSPTVLSSVGEYAKVTTDSSNNAYVIWDEIVIDGQKTKVMEARRNNSNGVFSTPFEVTSDAAYSFWGYPIDGVTTDTSGNAYVGWGQQEQDGTVTARYRKWTASNDSWSTTSIIRTTADMDSPFIFKDKWDNQHFIWTEKNGSTGMWETWYSVVPSMVGQFTPGNQLVLTHPITSDTLTIPGNALATAATISAQIGPLPASFSNGFTTIRRSYTYRPHGTTFAAAVSALIRYTDPEILGADERNMQLYLWDSSLQTPAWVTPSGSVNTAQNRITVSLNHFSLYGMSSPLVNVAWAGPGATTTGATVPVSFDLTYAHDGSAVPAVVDGLEDPVPGSNVALVLKDSNGSMVKRVYTDGPGDGTFAVNGATYATSIPTAGLTEGDYTLEVQIGGTHIGESSVHIVPAAAMTVNFLPPLTTQDLYTMNDGSTLPVKFTLLEEGDVVLTQESVSIEVTGLASSLSPGSFDSGTGQYHLNLKTKELGLALGTHTLSVKVDGVAVGQIDFVLLDGGKAKGK